ncbi:MAG: hypothetical protein HY296_00440 [Thaumarchaeota archaeon]|nr:hypothetical protein [Nitrososphaerota archaeon]
MSLSETARTPGDVTLEFVLEMTSQPNVARIVISGSAVMEGTKQEIQQMLVSEDPKRAPPVLNKIYERVYGTVYLLCDAMMVPHPLPNLLRV